MCIIVKFCVVFTMSFTLTQVWGYMGMTVVLAAIAIPALLALHSGSLVALWLLLPLVLGGCGCLGGLMTSIGPSIYPAVSVTYMPSSGGPLLTGPVESTSQDCACMRRTVVAAPADVL